MGEQAISMECEGKLNESNDHSFLAKILHAIARFTAHLIIKFRLLVLGFTPNLQPFIVIEQIAFLHNLG